MADTKIDWAEKSWNPVTGCSKISPGCANCYAERMSKRLAGQCGYPKENPFAVTLHPDKLDEPLRWKKPKRIFVCSMGDLFHDDVPFEVINRIWATMISVVCREHTFMILTKRPERMLEFYEWTQKRIRQGIFGVEFEGNHIWIGVTAENQEQADKRIPILLQIPAAVRFVSVEPMLGPVKFRPYTLTGRPCFVCECEDELGEARGTQSHPINCGWRKDQGKGQGGIDIVICGTESGPNRRKTPIDCIRNLRDQCVSAGVKFFLKQMEIGGKLAKMPELDGQVWAQWPEVRHG